MTCDETIESSVDRVKKLRDVLEEIAFEGITYYKRDEEAYVQWNLPYNKHSDDPLVRICYDGYEFDVEIENKDTVSFSNIFHYLRNER